MNKLNFIRWAVVSLCFLFSAAQAQNNPPEPQTNFTLADQFSTAFNEAISFDLNVYFSDPDNDPLTFAHPQWAPLPPGLTLDSATGLVTGILESDALLGRPMYFIATDDSGAASGVQVIVLWSTMSYGVGADLGIRSCDRFNDPIQCVPLPEFPRGGNYRSAALTFLGDDSPVPSQTAVLYPDPSANVPFRASASVGYEGSELTPAISAFLRPDEERMTAQQYGIAQHVTNAELAITAELTYMQTGGEIAPTNPNPGDELDFGALSSASLFALRLAPEAGGVFDPSMCDWNVWGPGAWGAGIREAIACLLTPGMHPHVLDLQQAFFTLPDSGPEEAGNPTVLPPESAGFAEASLTVTHDPTNPTAWIGIRLFEVARFHGEVDSQNTLRVVFENPEAAEPAMPTVQESTFVPAPDDTGDVSIGQGDCLKIDGHGFVKLTIWGKPDMMAEAVNPFSIQLAGLDLAIRGESGHPSCSIDDLNLDGFQDLQCRFVDDLEKWAGSEGRVNLFWSIPSSGQSYTGYDDICLK